MAALEIVRLADSTQRLVRTVDALDEDALAGPSLLPGWTRSHVVAHLALNAEGMARGLEGVRSSSPVPLYDSPEQRSADIDELAQASCTEVRERFLGATGTLTAALEQVPEEALAEEVAWYPGGFRHPVASFPEVRRGEVEVHHADLATDGYDHTSWPGDFCAWLLGARAAAAEVEPPFTAYAADLDRRWSFGGAAEDDPAAVVVTGPAPALAWWVAGRGAGEGLAVDGPIPRIGAW